MASRPKRLILVTVLDCVFGGIALLALSTIIAQPELRFELDLSVIRIVIIGFSALCLIGAAAWAFFGHRYGRIALLYVSVAYFGYIMVQNAVALFDSSFANLDHAQVRTKLLGNVARNCLHVGLNVWALTSPKTTAYFAKNSALPNRPLQPTSGGQAEVE